MKEKVQEGRRLRKIARREDPGEERDSRHTAGISQITNRSEIPPERHSSEESEKMAEKQKVRIKTKTIVLDNNNNK